MAKRALDIIASAVGLIMASPMLLVVAVLIKWTDRGAVLYRAPRVGLRGRMFRMYKFRTMVANADTVGGPSTSDGDPRITPIGAVLRKYKLDELPQLMNVLRGEMSVVGPRPEVRQYVDLYTEEEQAILTVKPGMTDLATLWNCDEGAVLAGAADPERAYLELIRPTKIALQLEYVRRRRLSLDLWIIWKTVAGVLTRSKPAALQVITPSPPRNA